jgi:glycine oxidase
MTGKEKTHRNQIADVIIVGGGVIGLMIARSLGQKGLDVALIERGELGTEASYAAGGILGPQAEANRADEFFELASQSRNLYPDLARELLDETGIDIELDTNGTLYLAFTEADEVEVARRYEWQTRAGLPINRLTVAEARQIEPVIAEDVGSVLHFPGDIQVDNRRLLTALIAANKQLGVQLLTGIGVDSIEIAAGRISGVITSQGRLSTRRVVLAAGAWTSLISAADDTSLPRVRIEPVRGQMVCLQTSPRIARHVLYSPRGYVVPRRDGRVLAGSTTEEVGFAKEVTARGVAQILNHALEIAPGLASALLIGTWAGFRPRAEDHLPVLGPCDINGLFYATGHYRNGILLAPISARLIVEAIISNVTSPLLSRFAPQRFNLVGAR